MCAARCDCGDSVCKQCITHPWFRIQSNVGDDDIAVRNVCDDDECELSLLISDIIEKHDCSHDSADVISSEDMLYSIIANFARIFDVADVKDYCLACCSVCEDLITNAIQGYFE